MKSLKQVREVLIEECKNYVNSQVQHIQDAISGAQESAKNESKSSAGDKHETGKSQMQLEQEKNSVLLQRMMLQKKVFPYLDNYVSNGKVQLGSYVQTTQGNYFIAIGLGLIEIQGIKCFVVSPSAPIGKRLIDSEIGDSFEMNGKTIKVTEIL